MGEKVWGAPDIVLKSKALVLLGRKLKGQLKQAYEGFLELPVPVVLAMMWIAGVALIGLCAMALLTLFWLLRVVGGA